MGDFFVRRPIVAIVISIFIVIIGGLALLGVPVAQYPEITPPSVEVRTSYTGANALNIEQAIATPIEQKVNGVENMLYMKSTNAGDGTMNLVVTFEVGTNLDNANMLTQNRVTQATPTLPLEVKNFGVTVQKSMSFPLMLVALTSPKGTYSNSFLSNYAKINLQDNISRIRGISRVNLFGGSDYSMRVWIKPDRLMKLGLTVGDISQAIQGQNLIAPGGRFGGNPAPPGTDFTYTVQLRDRLKTEAEFGEIIVRENENAQQIRLKDVARIELGNESYDNIARMNGAPGAVMAIYQTPGSNALDVAEQVKAAMEAASERFPEDVVHNISLDTTKAVTAGIEEIIHTLFEAVVLVLIVVFIFLQNWRATLIPLLTVPVSLIGVFSVFPLLGFSVNVLSLLGLVLAIGIVVDDAIVVVEAVMHNIEHGLDPKEATRKAMKEVTGPVIAIALILAAVFIPVAMTPGITGRLYQQFAITIAVSVLFSAICALTLSPALSSLLLKPHQQSGGLLGKFFTAFNKLFDRFTGGYTGVAGLLIKKSARSVIIIVLITAGAVFLGMKVPGGFVPEEDQGYFIISVNLPDGASLQRTDAACKKIEGLLAKIPAIEFATTVAGNSLVTGTNSPSAAFFFISLKEWNDREGTAKEIVGQVNRLLATSLPEATAFAFGPPPIQGLGVSAGFSLMLQDKGGNDPQYLAAMTRKFMEAASQRPEIGRISTTYRASAPQIRIDIDRDKALKLGVPLNEVNAALAANLGGQYVNDFNRFGRQYKVFIQSEPEYRAKPEDIANFFARNRDGRMVPIATFAAVEKVSGPDFTYRHNMYRAAEVTGAPGPGMSSSQAMKALEEVAAQVLPRDMGFEWTNVSFQEKQSEGKGGTVFIFALLFVFLILAAQYESWSLPFSVLLGTPFAVFGAFLGLYLSRLFSESYVNNVFAQIGLVMLIGLAAKNAILIVEFAREEYEKGKPLIEAALYSARLRFRPILMTAFAFILGVVPLLTATGAGAEARKVMGMTVFSGMLVATILGVLLVPLLFVVIEKLGGKNHPTTITSPKSNPEGH
ncbi:MAG TPA: multidrug efflux RND transporter permease subunit [Cyclobacteriaceae bacterium]|nr:multidrug efflux RND transporter permease subunit [Cyclobacteriaceae bacterium]